MLGDCTTIVVTGRMMECCRVVCDFAIVLPAMLIRMLGLLGLKDEINLAHNGDVGAACLIRLSRGYVGIFT